MAVTALPGYQVNAAGNGVVPTGTPPPLPTLSTTFPTPASTTTTAPAVYTSQPAQDNLDTISATNDQANNDVANYNAAKNQPTPATSTATPATATTQPVTLDPTIQSILDGLSGADTSASQDTVNTDQNSVNDLTQEQNLDYSELDPSNPNSVASTINSMNAGTYPLTPSEQAQVNAAGDGYAGALQQAQTQLNALPQGVTGEVGAKTGVSTASYQKVLADIKTAINTTQDSVGKINLSILDAQQKLTASIQAGDYKSATALYKQINTQINQRQSQITALNTEIDRQQTNMKDLATTQMQAVMDSNTISYQQKQQALAQSTLDEKTKNDLATQADNQVKNQIAEQAAAKGVYQIKTNPDGTDSIFNTETGEIMGSPTNEVANGVVQPGQTGIPILDNNTQTSSTGVPYIDGTTLTGTEATAAQLDAAKLGIPYLGKASASAIVNINAALTDLQNMQQINQKINPSNGLTRPFDALGHAIESVTQLGPSSDDVNSYHAYNTDAVKYIQGLAGGGTGVRINQATIATMIASLPSYNDTQSVAAAKAAVLTTLLHSNERAIIGEKAYDQYNPDQSATDLANLYKNSPQYATHIDTLRQQGLDPSQILQVILP